MARNICKKSKQGTNKYKATDNKFNKIETYIKKLEDIKTRFERKTKSHF